MLNMVSSMTFGQPEEQSPRTHDLSDHKCLSTFLFCDVKTATFYLKAS